MKMINKEEIEKYVNDTIKNNKLQKINDFYLSKRQIDILEKYNIDYKNVLDIKELIFNIENYLNDNYCSSDLYDLDNLSRELSEFNYYYRTNK